jgi:hypothetical protein
MMTTKYKQGTSAAGKAAISLPGIAGNESSFAQRDFLIASARFLIDRAYRLEIPASCWKQSPTAVSNRRWIDVLNFPISAASSPCLRPLTGDRIDTSLIISGGLL